MCCYNIVVVHNTRALLLVQQLVPTGSPGLVWPSTPGLTRIYGTDRWAGMAGFITLYNTYFSGRILFWPQLNIIAKIS